MKLFEHSSMATLIVLLLGHQELPGASHSSSPAGSVEAARDSAGSNKAHCLTILPPKWHLPRQLTVPPAEPGHMGFVPRAGSPPSFSPRPPLSRWEKQHVKQRCGMSFVLLTLVTLTKRKKKKKWCYHFASFLLCKPFDIHKSLQVNKRRRQLLPLSLAQLKELQFQVSKEIQCNLIWHTLWFLTKKWT